MTEDLTVIIVVLVGGEALRACAEAVRAQVSHLLVVSPDGTVTDASGKRIGAAEHCNIPCKRKRAVELASTPFVTLIEDTVIPRPGWAAAVASALQRSAAVACGGPVLIADGLPASSSALALSEYGAYSNRKPAGPAATLPGCNFAFRRDALVKAMTGSEGLVDQIVFERLRKHGGQLVWASGMAVEFCHANDEGARLATRFHHGRIYASSRDRRDLTHRVSAAAKALLLPPLLTMRSLRHAVHAKQLSLPTLGWVVLQHTAWAAGELAGAVFGSSAKGLSEWR